MTQDVTLGQKIKRQFETECRGPFPTAEIARLRSRDPNNLDLFHGQLEMYLSYIAGYASSADRLDRRPRTELVESKRQLSLSFFEKYPLHYVYRDGITSQATPGLFLE